MYINITDIVTKIRRSYLSELELEFEFKSEYDSTFEIRCYVNENDKRKKDRKYYELSKCFKPDGTIRFESFEFYLEYDRGTEGQKKIEKKMELVMDTFFLPTGLSRTPIPEIINIWVVSDNVRAEKLHSIWVRVRSSNKYTGWIKELINKNSTPPVMYFITEDNFISTLKRSLEQKK